MIVTVTLNPSLDRTVEVPGLDRGAVIRAGATHLDPGGKGVNVARALLANGRAGRAVLPAAGPDGDQLLALLAAEGVDTAVVPVTGRTRSNISIAEADGTVTKINEPGAPLRPEELDEVLAAVLAAAAETAATWVVLCGSLPPGVGEDHYAALVRTVRAAGLAVAVDTSGPALRAALGARPDLVKPNLEELEAAVGRTLTTRGAVVEAARELLTAGVGRVLVSLGGDGAVLVDDDHLLVGSSTVADPRSTVGAGDAFLAGYLAATVDGASAPDVAAHRPGPEAALTQALAWGAAAVRLPGSRMPGPADIDPSAVTLISPDQLPAQLAAPLAGAVAPRS